MRTLRAVLALACLAQLVLASSVPDLYAACSAALGIPRVALLFLASNDLHFRPLWRDWLLSARGMLPIPQVHRAAITGPDLSSAEQRVERALEACRHVPTTAKPAYQQVHTLVHSQRNHLLLVLHSFCSRSTSTQVQTPSTATTASLPMRRSCRVASPLAGAKSASLQPSACCWSLP